MNDKAFRTNLRSNHVWAPFTGKTVILLDCLTLTKQGLKAIIQLNLWVFNLWTWMFSNPQMVPFSWGRGGGGIRLSPLLQWGHFVPNYFNPCRPFKSLWEMNRVQIRRKVDNKATPAITTETWHHKKYDCAQRKLTTVDPHQRKHGAPPLMWGWSTAGDMKLPKKTPLNRVSHRWEPSCAIR